MPAPRHVLRRLLLVLALGGPTLGLAACGEDAESTSARVGPGADAPARTAPVGEAEKAADGVPEAAGDAAEGASEGAVDAAGEAAAGAGDAVAGAAPGGADPGETPYEGDGDGDSSDDGAGAGPGGGGTDAGAGEATGGTAPPGPAAAGGAEAGAEAGAGDEEPVAVQASFTVEDGGASPMRAEVPAFLAITLEVENAEGRAVEVRLRAPGAEAFTVGPGETASRTVTGVPPGLYPLEVDGGASGAVVVAEG